MSDNGSLVLYLGTFVLSALLLYHGIARSNKVTTAIAITLPAVLGGLRFGVGTDFVIYDAIYNQLSPINVIQYLSLEKMDIEIGFYALVKLSELISGNSFFMFFASSLITTLFFYLGLKRFINRHIAFAYFLFLTILFPFSFNGIRQGIAISVCFFAFSFVMDKSWRKYLIWVLIAALFHKSALFLLPFYLLNVFVDQDDVKKRYLALKVMLVAAATYLILPFTYQLLQAVALFDKYEAYKDITAEGNNYVFFLKVAILFIVIGFYKRIVIRNRLAALFLVFAVLDVVLSTLGFVSPFVKRIALYFSLFTPLLLVFIPDVFEDRLGKFLSYGLLILYGLLYFYLAYFVMGQSDIFPYRFIWSQ